MDQALREAGDGHVLVFLPGAGEIRRAQRTCEPLARQAGALLLPLHGSLSPEEQDRAVAPSRQRKIILSTNVAESSVTIAGVSTVIDSGLARVASHSPWSGLPTLHVSRISKASAAQRAGRAGRTGPGQVYRLYPQEDFAQRAAFDLPEILRSELSGLCLFLLAMGVADPYALRWLDAPPPAAVQGAQTLLERLSLTAKTAGAAARLPLPPRLARLLLAAMERGVGRRGIAAAALLAGDARQDTRQDAADLLQALDLPPDPQTRRQAEQLQRIVRAAGRDEPGDDALLLAVLAGFPDRVARFRAGKQVLLSTGVTAELAGERPPYEFMVVLHAEQRGEQQMPLARMTARVEPEWLLDLFPERVREEVALEWNSRIERVEEVRRLLYDELVLDETRGVPRDIHAATNLLLERAEAGGLDHFVDAVALGELLARFAFAGLPAPDLAQTLRGLADGLRSFAELRTVAGRLLASVEEAQGRTLRELAPATLKLPSGRQVRIRYETGKPPSIASRLQDFFGMADTPRIGRDRQPVLLLLLAPNGRPVQTTTDLRGFWERLYPQVRRELMRRYPRHAWPERP